MNQLSASKNEIGKDIFQIPINNNDYIIYSPLRQILLKANASGVSAVQEFLSGNNLEKSEFVQTVEQTGLFTPLQEDKVTKLFNKQRPPLSMVTFSLTYSCNLKCVYCYANGGDISGKIDEKTLRPAIELAAKNSKIAGYEVLRVSFHGTGEATLAWDLIEKGVKITKDVATEYNLRPFISLLTNATNITTDRADYIFKHNIHMSISLDGDKSIQDAQRPFRNGKGSFSRINKSIRIFQEKGVHFSIRATVLPENVSRLSEIVEFVALEVYKGAGKLHLEPVEKCGRATNDSSVEELDPDVFIENYKKAVAVGESLGIQVSCSSDFRLGFRNFFCNANGRIFLVLPTGEISSCTRVTMQTDSLAGTFMYGKFDEKSQDFVIDQQRLENLLSIGIENNSKCSNCFCKWHCGGHCVTASMSENGHWDKMCYITRELAKWRLSNLLEQ